MELSYPNYHLENHEGYGHVTRPDNVLELTDHASIQNGSTPEKNPPQVHSDIFDDEGPSNEPKTDIEGKEPVADRNQNSVSVSPKCYNSSEQLVQLKQTPRHREEAGTGVSYFPTPKYQELLIDPSPWCLLLHTALDLREIIVARLARENNTIHPEVVTEDGIEYSDEEKQFCWSHRKRKGS